MPTPPVTEAQTKRVLKRYEPYAGLTVSQAAKKMGMPHETLRTYLGRYATRFGLEVPEQTHPYTVSKRRATQPAIITETHEIPELPDDDLPVEDIIEARKREFAQKKLHEEATRLIPINIKIHGPIGILHFGDPHLDDDGTDIGQAFYHAELTKKVEGLFGANVGDTTNAWVGRLARLYAEQNMGRKRALRVAEHFVRSANWLYMVGGNHDGWAGEDDPIKWISKQQKTLYRPSEARLELRFPAGEPFTINARHDFAGHSMWNPAHGPMKAMQMGSHDELFTCGHKHVSGYGVLKSPDGTICHALQIGSYKLYDRFAKEKGFRDQSLGPAALTVIDPALPKTHPDRCKVFWEPDEGVEFLKFKRRTFVR